MRVVVDTNIFVSSFYDGNPRAVISLWQNGRIRLCVSKSVLEEYVEVLMRMVRHKDLVPEILHLFEQGHSIVFTASTPAIKIVSDPDDDKFLECAVALDAEMVVSGDKALLDVKEYAGIKIMKPADFLTWIKTGGGTD